MIRLPADDAARTARLIATVADSAWKRSWDPQDYFEDLDAEEVARTARVLVAALGQENEPGTRWWLAAGLCVLAEKLEPDEAARVCAPVVEDMGRAHATGNPARHDGIFLIRGFVVVASRQGPAVASRSARVVMDALNRDIDGALRLRLSEGLATLAAAIEPVEAERMCGEAARVNARALRRNGHYAARSLAMVTSRMKPIEVGRISAEAVRTSLEGWAVFDCDAVGDSAAALADLTSRLEPNEAARVLADILGREIDDDIRMTRTEGNSRSWRLPIFAKALASVAARLEPAAAARVCESTIRSLFRARSSKPRDAEDRFYIDSSIAELFPLLEAQKANAVAANLAATMCSEGNLDWEHTYDSTPPPELQLIPATAVLSQLLTDTGRTQRDRGALCVPMPTGMSARPVAPALAAEPWRCRLTAQELVDLLKMPTCAGKARRVVLDHLGRIHGRRFANHWEFVRFAREQKLPLDFNTPPRRRSPTALAAALAPTS